MPWLKIDDSFSRHPKLARLSYEDRWRHLDAMSWCSSAHTDGRIDREDLPLIWPGMPPKMALKLASRLQTAGLWDATDNGWGIHDWLQYNLPSEQSKEMRDREAERKRKWREKRRREREETRRRREDVPPDATEYVPPDATEDVPPHVPTLPRARKTRPDPTPSPPKEGRVDGTAASPPPASQEPAARPIADPPTATPYEARHDPEAVRAAIDEATENSEVLRSVRRRRAGRSAPGAAA